MKEKEYGVRLRWLCASCYEIVCGDTHIVTDPYITHCETTDLTWEAIERCDILALTHNHWDHMTDIPSLMARFNPLLLCPEQSMIYLAKWLNCCPSRIYPMYADVELDFGDVKVRPLYTRHIRLTRNHRSICDALDRNPVNEKVPGMIDVQHIGNLDCRSYLFTLKNGTKVLYWLGNLSKEQYTLCAALKPDIAILQRAVKDWGITRRAEFAAAIGARIVLPQHMEVRHNDFPESIPFFRDEFNRLAPDRTFIIPKNGEWIEL